MSPNSGPGQQYPYGGYGQSDPYQQNSPNSARSQAYPRAPFPQTSDLRGSPQGGRSGERFPAGYPGAGGQDVRPDALDPDSEAWLYPPEDQERRR